MIIIAGAHCICEIYSITKQIVSVYNEFLVSVLLICGIFVNHFDNKNNIYLIITKENRSYTAYCNHNPILYSLDCSMSNTCVTSDTNK
jgi:hypothetical protein